MTDKIALTNRLLSLLVHFPEDVVVIGTGSQACQMRRYFELRFRTRMTQVKGCSSQEAQVGKAFYILCATPRGDAVATLKKNGINPDSMIDWPELNQILDAWIEDSSVNRFGLRALDDEGIPIQTKKVDSRVSSLLCHIENILLGFYIPDESDPDFDLGLLKIISDNYLALRRHVALRLGEKERKLLFPSAGRCGGVSLTHALRSHPRIYLRVDHEGFAESIYRFLALRRQNRFGDSVLIALLSVLADRFDCLGGNPFCFLMPYLSFLPWLDTYTLKVERGLDDHCESIMLRNFHYTKADFVSERITAAAWGDVSQQDWDEWNLETRIRWYLKTVDAEIERSLATCSRAVRTTLSTIHSGTNELMASMHWPTLDEFPHLNAIPKNKVYSIEERIRFYNNDLESI